MEVIEEIEVSKRKFYLEQISLETYVGKHPHDGCREVVVVVMAQNRWSPLLFYINMVCSLRLLSRPPSFLYLYK